MASPLDRQELFADRSRKGLELCRAYSERVDRWIGEIFADAGSPEDCALVAVGGYGRSELSPQSDIDLVLVHRSRKDVRDVAEKIWYPIWDESLKLGHAVRTVKEAVALASDDLETATSLLSCRLIAGDAALADELSSRAIGLWQKRAKRFLAELSRSVKDRHGQAGEVAFLLEPDLKGGRGGLRDVHAMRWAEASNTLLLDRDDDTVQHAYDVLLEVRVELHRSTGRPNDQLSLQDQDAVADVLGYGSADALMRAVSSAARDIAWMSDEHWYRLDSSLQGPSRLRSSRDKLLSPGIVLREGQIHVTAEADVAGDALLPLRTAVHAAQLDAHIDWASLWRLAAGAPPLPFRWDSEARELFAALFLAGGPAIGVVEALDRTGLWVRLVPEWEGVRCKPQRNAYHTYTVDRHLCVAAVNASALADTVDRPDLLVVGTLLHDIGKGVPGDHTEVGIEMVGEIGERMGYAPAEIGLLQDMVRYHLLLPDVATRRDLDDDETIERVAEQVQSLDLLSLLHALTEADSIATGPAAWNSWKAGLVKELVTSVAHVLGGGHAREITAEVFPTVELLERMDATDLDIQGDGNRLTVIAPDRPGLFSRVTGVLALHGLDVLQARAYSNDSGKALEVIKVESSIGPVIAWAGVLRDLELALQGRLALRARLADRARRYARPAIGARVVLKSAEARVHIDRDSSTTSTVVEVHCRDQVGVLSRITSAIAELELDIRSAKVHTLGDEVVDSFYLCDQAGNRVDDDDYLAELERAILHAVTSES